MPSIKKYDKSENHYNNKTALSLPEARVPIGLRLRDRRQELGFTQTGLARKVGISVSYLNLIEHNKRAIGGALLNRLARELRVDMDVLTGSSDARLIQDLSDIVTDPALQNFGLKPESASELVAANVRWARTILGLYRAYCNRMSQLESIAERLSQDPYIEETGTEILSLVTSVRSFADILAQFEDIDEAQRSKFIKILSQESGNLGLLVRDFLARVNSQEMRALRGTSPMEEVEDFLIDHHNYFPALEECACLIRREVDKQSSFLTGMLANMLSNRYGVVVCRVTTDDPLASRFKKGYCFDKEESRLYVLESLADETLRFQMARSLAQLAFEDKVNVLLCSEESFTSSESVELARKALFSYIAGAILYPYESFLDYAQKHRYDIDQIILHFGGSFEQICHRLTTLRRPGSEGIPFAFLRADLAGNTSKRLSIAGLRMPRYGNACPLWALYQAYLTPERPVVQFARFSNNATYLFLARMVSKNKVAYRIPRERYSVMISCDAVYADQTVYGSGLDLANEATVVPVGPTCRLCPRERCDQRAHPSILKE